MSTLSGEEATIRLSRVASIGSCSVRGHYGSLDAVDGVLLWVDPVSDVSSGIDGGEQGRG